MNIVFFNLNNVNKEIAIYCEMWVIGVFNVIWLSIVDVIFAIIFSTRTFVTLDFLDLFLILILHP